MCFTPPTPAFHGIKGIQRQHSQHGGDQKRSHNPNVCEKTHARAAQRERPDSITPKRPMRQIQRDCEHAQEWQVFGVKERVGVQSRMQQENQHGEQRDKPAAKQSIRQQPREETAGEKEGVSD